jgi:hypothetical protein
MVRSTSCAPISKEYSHDVATDEIHRHQGHAEEYGRIQGLAREQPISEWVRAALLKAADASPADSIVLAEVLALRTILLNLHFQLASGTPLSAEAMQRLMERADQDKRQQAEARLLATLDRRQP